MRVVLFRLRIVLRSRWRTTAVLTLVVALAGGFVLVIAAGAARTLTASDRYESAQDIQFDAIVEQNSGAPRTGELAELPAVDDIRSITFVFAGLIPDGREAPADALIFAGSQSAFGTHMVQGREPDPSRPSEFVASESFVLATGAHLGDDFTLITISQDQSEASGFDVQVPEGPTLTATLVGTFTGPTELQDGYATALFPPTLLEAGDIGVAASQHAVELAAGSTVGDLRTQLDGMTDGQFGIDPADPVPPVVRDAVNARGQGIAVVAAIVALAAIATVGQLLGRRVRLSDLEEDVMSAVGMTPRQLVVDPVGQAAVPVALGSALAAILAVVCSGLFPLGFVELVEPSPGLRFDPVVHLIGPLVIALALVGWVTVAVAAGRRQGRERRPWALVDAVARRARPVQATVAVRFAFNRQSRDSSSPIAPLIGLVLVLGGLIAALTFGASLTRQLDEPARYGAPDLSVGEGGDEIDPGVQAALEQSPAVEAMALAGTVLASVGTTSVDITGLEPVRGDMRPETLAGRLPTAPDEVALGRVTARDLGVGVGDTIELKAASGATRLRVVGLAVLPSVAGGDSVGLGGLVTIDELKRLDPDATVATINVDLRDDITRAERRELSDQVGRAIGQPDAPGVIRNLQRVRSLPFVVAATLGLLAALSLAHQLLMSARNRRRDVAILGAFGADRRWLSWVVHWQATLTAVVALVLAVPVGFAIGRLIYLAFIDRVGSDDAVTLHLWMLGVTIVVTLALANLVATPSVRRVRRLPLAHYLGDG
ncbi:hypothetical protein BH10ACT3_BH10ACT3_07770 [soil metagenome]